MMTSVAKGRRLCGDQGWVQIHILGSNTNTTQPNEIHCFSKFQSNYKSYRVEERMSPESPLYHVQRVDGLGQPKIVHHSAILDVKDIRVPADNMVTAPEDSQCTHDNVMDNHVNSTSERSSTSVNRWMILHNGNRPQMPTVRAETVPSTPVIQDGALEEERPKSSESPKHAMDDNTLEQEQSLTLVCDYARGSQSLDSRPVRAPARSSPSVDSDGDSTSVRSTTVSTTPSCQD